MSFVPLEFVACIAIFALATFADVVKNRSRYNHEGRCIQCARRSKAVQGKKKRSELSKRLGVVKVSVLALFGKKKRRGK